MPCAPRFAFTLVRFRTERPGDEFSLDHFPEDSQGPLSLPCQHGSARRYRHSVLNTAIFPKKLQSANQGRTGDLKSVKSKIKIRTKNVSDRVPINCGIECAMSDHESYENPLISRYASPKMARLFSPKARVSTWRRLWVAPGRGAAIARACDHRGANRRAS